MANNLEKLIEIIYKKWQRGAIEKITTHPDEESIAGFLEGRLPDEELEQIRQHLIACDSCAEAVAIQLDLGELPQMQVPDELVARAKGLVTEEGKVSILEIILKLGDDVLELLNTTGDVLVGQEFMPAPVLRARKIKDFKDEVTILKDFKDLRVELKIENKSGKNFSVTVVVKEKQTHKILKDLRATLVRDGLELESYIGDSGAVTFEHVLVGKYTVRISDVNATLVSLLLDVRI